MAQGHPHDLRTELLRTLLQKVADEQHPSGTTLNLVEHLLRTPDEVQLYVGLLMEKLESDLYPSVDAMNRLLRQAS